MSDIDAIKAAIAETNDALSQKVKILEQNVKETATSIKETVEQGATNVRNVANAFSPVYQLKEHPFVFTGALLGLGVYLGSRSGRKKSAEIVINTPGIKEEPSETTAASENNEPVSTPWEPASPSKIRAIAEPAVIGLFAAVAGEVVKRYFPKIEDQATAVQSALIAEMTGRIVQEFNAPSN